jgi:hypothetical protein
MFTIDAQVPRPVRRPVLPVPVDGPKAFAEHGAAGHSAVTTRPRPARPLTLARAGKGQPCAPIRTTTQPTTLDKVPAQFPALRGSQTEGQRS